LLQQNFGRGVCFDCSCHSDAIKQASSKKWKNAKLSVFYKKKTV